MNYPNKQSRKGIYILLYDLAENCKSAEVAFLCLGRNWKSVKITRPTWFRFMGRFGSPATTEPRGVWPLSSQLNTNIWKSENPFQKRRHSDSVFWNQQSGPPVAEMLKSLTKPGATNYVDWNKLLSSEPWTSILNVAVGNILKCIYVHFWDTFYIWILFNKYINIHKCQYTGKINVN